MKATGIVRRVDDLGRIVIPKEIRYIQHFSEEYIVPHKELQRSGNSTPLNAAVFTIAG